MVPSTAASIELSDFDDALAKIKFLFLSLL